MKTMSYFDTISKYYYSTSYKFKHKIAQTGHPWNSMAHTLHDKHQGDPTELTFQFFHGGSICKQNRSLFG